MFLFPILQTILYRLQIKYRPHFMSNGCLLFCDAKGNTFDICLQDDGFLQIWRLYPEVIPSTKENRKVEYRVNAPARSIGFAQTQEDGLMIYMQANLSDVSDSSETLSRYLECQLKHYLAIISNLKISAQSEI